MLSTLKSSGVEDTPLVREVEYRGDDQLSGNVILDGGGIDPAIIARSSNMPCKYRFCRGNHLAVLISDMDQIMTGRSIQ